MIVFLSIWILFFPPIDQDKKDLWDVFGKVKFESIYNEKESTYLLYPEFTSELKEMEGKEVEITGFYIPMSLDANVIVISRTNYASCFFCGNAGPETVVEVEPRNKFRDFTMDEKITIKGKLKLNRDDIFRLNFILEEGEVVDD
jgi:uncharacterized membrane protein YcgQ (UPF0703/DUF1980 family)